MAARIRGLLVLSGVAATLLAGVIAGPAAEAQSATCATPTATLTVNPTTVAAGQTLQITGSNYTPYATITFFDNGQMVGTNTVLPGGGISGPYTIPATATTGQHTLVGSDAGGRCGSTTFTVTGGSGTTAATATTTPCPAGYAQSGNQCVASGTAVGGGVCQTGYYYDGTRCVAGAYPGTYPGPYSGAYPGVPTGQGGCPAGYVNIGYACQAGPYAGAYCPPTGAPPGSGCAAAQPASASTPYSTTPYSTTPYSTTPYSTTATTVVQAAPQAAASGRVAYTGSRTVHSAAIGLALLLGGLMLLSARAVVAPFRR